MSETLTAAEIFVEKLRARDERYKAIDNGLLLDFYRKYEGMMGPVQRLEDMHTSMLKPGELVLGAKADVSTEAMMVASVFYKIMTSLEPAMSESEKIETKFHWSVAQELFGTAKKLMGEIDQERLAAQPKGWRKFLPGLGTRQTTSDQSRLH